MEEGEYFDFESYNKKIPHRYYYLNIAHYDEVKVLLVDSPKTGARFTDRDIFSPHVPLRPYAYYVAQQYLEQQQQQALDESGGVLYPDGLIFEGEPLDKQTPTKNTDTSTANRPDTVDLFSFL